MSSHLTGSARRIPRQPRGERRVSALLDAAGEVIGEAGYEAATMSEIAERAGASIGSLYQFFPNKESVAQALGAQYCEEIGGAWQRLENESKSLTIELLVNRLLDSTIEFLNMHPAFLALLDVPIDKNRKAEIRRRYQDVLCALVRKLKPRMSLAKATRVASVMLEIVKAFVTLYRNLKPAERAGFTQEFKTALGCYLTTRLGGAN